MKYGLRSIDGSCAHRMRQRRMHHIPRQRLPTPRVLRSRASRLVNEIIPKWDPKLTVESDFLSLAPEKRSENEKNKKKEDADLYFDPDFSQGGQWSDCVEVFAKHLRRPGSTPTTDGDRSSVQQTTTNASIREAAHPTCSSENVPAQRRRRTLRDRGYVLADGRTQQPAPLQFVLADENTSNEWGTVEEIPVKLNIVDPSRALTVFFNNKHTHRKLTSDLQHPYAAEYRALLAALRNWSARISIRA